MIASRIAEFMRDLTEISVKYGIKIEGQRPQLKTLEVVELPGGYSATSRSNDKVEFKWVEQDC